VRAGRRDESCFPGFDHSSGRSPLAGLARGSPIQPRLARTPISKLTSFPSILRADGNCVVCRCFWPDSHHGLALAASLVGVRAAGVIDQNPPHALGGRPEEGIAGLE
jgi:hypothetical protein